MTTLIKNCNLISPDIEILGASILIEADKIGGIFSCDEQLPFADNIIEAEGKNTVPGFIDIHTHGCGGYDTTDGKSSSIEHIAKLKIEEGVTSFCPTTLTVSGEELMRSAESVEEYKRTLQYAKVPGIHLEGPYINSKCLGAQNPEYVRMPDIEEVKRLDAVSKIAIVSYAVEIEGGIEFTKQLKDMGIVASCGHSEATFKEFSKAKNAGLAHLTHFCNQMTKLHHREIGLVGAGLLDQDILIEMICDKIHLSEDMIKLAFASKQVEKIALITDAISASWLEDGSYDLGGLAVMVSEGAARLVSNGALAGSTLKYYEGLRNAYESTNLPLKQLIKATSYSQALSLGLEKHGKLERGFFADICILNRDFSPFAVFVNGKRLR